jgi:hypothetical protein
LVNISIPLGLAAMVRTVAPARVEDELGAEDVAAVEAAGWALDELEAVDAGGELEAAWLDELLLEPPQAATPRASAPALRRAMGNLVMGKAPWAVSWPSGDRNGREEGSSPLQTPLPALPSRSSAAD